MRRNSQAVTHDDATHKVTQLLTCSPQIWYRSFAYTQKHWQGEGSELAKNGRQHDIAKLPKRTPTWFYCQDFAKFPLNHHYNVRLPSHQTTPIHSPSNLSDQPGFGFVISRSNKLRFTSRIPTNPETGSIRRQIFFSDSPAAGSYFLKKK
ncbi:hypothetical protein TNCV_2188361 [Trichonephila clavipes]|nr:hypothetical protein TNCV_2188361 [Trichonephila clavipes]